MKNLVLVVAVLLQIWYIEASNAGAQIGQDLAAALPAPREVDRVHARDVLIQRAGRDCGTWTFYCGGVPDNGGDGSTGRGRSAEGPCNNACYYINFQGSSDPRNPSYTASYRVDIDNDRSRQQSGCQTKTGGSVCNNMPFSQRFHDVFERETDPNAQKWSCDEFPMAGMDQNDFKSGSIRNSLRCVPASENSSGGQQLGAFIAGIGDSQKGRTCNGRLQDGDTYKVEFNYDGADKNKLPYCRYPGNTPNKNEDDFQFYMTTLGGTGGLLHFPYQPQKDNHYAIANTGKDVLHCHVEVTRTSGDSYSATVYDVNGAAQGTAAKQLTENSIFLEIAGQGGLLDLAIYRTGEMGKAGTKGSTVDFSYGAHGLLAFNVVADFVWSSDQQGCDNSYAKSDQDVVQPGGYCKVPNIEESENGDQQTITCYFPCDAA